MRLFVSVDVDELAEGIASVQEPFADAAGLRPTDPSQAHVTLKFLGDTEESRLPAIREALATAVEAADVTPFDATLGGLGVFPHLEYISVVWLGVREGAGTAELTRLHETVEAELTALGFDSEDHDFTPHVTLGRMDHAGGKELVQELVRERDPTVGTTTVSEICLTKSTLTEDGPRYEPVARVPL
jgi:2'-5' RNA ligase